MVNWSTDEGEFTWVVVLIEKIPKTMVNSQLGSFDFKRIPKSKGFGEETLVIFLLITE